MDPGPFAVGTYYYVVKAYRQQDWDLWHALRSDKAAEIEQLDRCPAPVEARRTCHGAAPN